MTALLLLAALSAPAQALELSVGPTVAYNDAFFSQSGLRGSAEQGLAPGIRTGLLGGFMVDFGRSDWSSLTHTLIEEVQVSPDISKVTWDLGVVLEVEPFRGRIGPVTTALGLYAGAGAQGTAEDLDALQAFDEPDTLSTASQVHFAQTWGTFSDVLLTEAWRLRFRWHHASWLETVEGVNTSRKSTAQIGLEAVVALGVRGGMGKPTAATPFGFRLPGGAL